MSAYDCFALSEKDPDGATNDDFVALDPEMGVFVVADGMGGRPGGAQASRVATRTFLDEMRTLDAAARTEEANLRRAVTKANDEVHQLAQSDALHTGMGTTFSAVVLDGARGKIIHVGDSRVYIFRAGKLTQLTSDHTLVAELIEQRRISEAGAKKHPLRHVLARCLGVQPLVEADVLDLALTPKDWLLLASDGLAKGLSTERLEKLLVTGKRESAEALCREIMASAIAESFDDDVTLAVVRLKE